MLQINYIAMYTCSCIINFFPALGTTTCILQMSTFTVKHSCSSLNDIDLPADTLILNCSGVQLESLEGCPSSVVQANFSRNQLQSLNGISKSIKILDVSYN